MPYTGSGTYDDPYIVDNFDDLKACVAISSAYVKVISNIDANMDDIGQIACASLYADELMEITNINRSSTVALDITGASTHINNINFKNMIFWPSSITPSTYNVIFRGSSTTVNTPVIENCKFSIQGNTRNAALFFSTGYITFNDCAVYAQFERTADSVSVSGDLVGTGCTMNKCVIDASGLGLNGSGGNLNFNCNFCAIKLEASISPLSYQRQIFTADSNHNILIFKNTTTGTASNPYNVNGLTVMDDENSEKIYATGTSLYKLTEAQVKSEEYLRSINFIP